MSAREPSSTPEPPRSIREPKPAPQKSRTERIMLAVLGVVALAAVIAFAAQNWPSKQAAVEPRDEQEMKAKAAATSEPSAAEVAPPVDSSPPTIVTAPAPPATATAAAQPAEDPKAAASASAASAALTAPTATAAAAATASAAPKATAKASAAPAAPKAAKPKKPTAPKVIGDPYD